MIKPKAVIDGFILFWIGVLIAAITIVFLVILGIAEAARSVVEEGRAMFKEGQARRKRE
jgi:hypothetical protein